MNVRTWRDLAAFCVAPFVNLQQRSRAFQIGQRHYDIGNGLYGRFLLHTIGSVGSTNHTDPWLHKYIFPNSMIPSQHQIAEAIEGLFLIDGWKRMGSHYDRTLLAWRATSDATGIRFPAPTMKVSLECGATT